jgi:hypothetical protein
VDFPWQHLPGVQNSADVLTRTQDLKVYKESGRTVSHYSGPRDLQALSPYIEQVTIMTISDIAPASPINGAARNGHPLNWEPLWEKPLRTPRKLRVVCIGVSFHGFLVLFEC